MSEENTKRTESAQTTQAAATPQTGGASDGARGGQRGGGDRRRNDRAGGERGERGGRRSRKPRERVRQEFDQQIVSIRRVTRVMAGGRRFSFSVTMVIGNRKGKVGVGLGKGGDTAAAIEKALRDAKQNMFEVPRTEDFSIAHAVHAKYKASDIMIMPAPGLGLRAGGSVRTVLELAGVKNVSAKILSRSKNRLNNARATILALNQLISK